jgi:drug/metabolite transporter (DMT)-like permease
MTQPRVADESEEVPGRRPGPRPDLVLVGVTLLWGSTFIVTKDIVHGAPPMAYLMLRYCLAAAVIVPLYGRSMLRDRRALVDGAVLGVLNSLGLVFQVIGQVYTSASKSAFITSLNTPLVPVVALAVYGTRPNRAQSWAVALATLGVALLTWPGRGAPWNAGDLLTVGCAILYAFTIIEIARRSRHHDARQLTAIQIATGALVFIAATAIARLLLVVLPPARVPEVVLLDARPLVPSVRLAAQILYLALVCTVATFALQTWAMARLSVTQAAVIFALEPVFATLFAVGVDGSAEWPGSRGAAGAGLVLIAVVVSEIRLPRRADPSDRLDE